MARNSLLCADVPLRIGPYTHSLIAARGSWGALKLPQRIRVVPGRQTYSGIVGVNSMKHFVISLFSRMVENKLVSNAV